MGGRPAWLPSAPPERGRGAEPPGLAFGQPEDRLSEAERGQLLEFSI